MPNRIFSLLLPLALVLATVDCGTSDDPTLVGIQLVTYDIVPNPLYEDDPSFDFVISFEFDGVNPGTDGISPEVVSATRGLSAEIFDELGVVFKRLDKVIKPELTGGARVTVPMPNVLPDLPAPGNVTIRIWDGDSYDTSTLRDEATVALILRDPIESYGTAGGGSLIKGVRTTIWGVNPYIDPTDPGLIYQGNLDIWVIKDTAASDTVQVDFGGWNGATALNEQFANVYLRNATSGEFVDQVVKRTPGKSAIVTVPEAGDYFVYVHHNVDEWPGTTEYRVEWQ
jgi:hypothetical protein